MPDRYNGRYGSDFSKSPHLVCIGAQRSGTTWLHECCATHPEICTSPIKKLHYFDAQYLPKECGVFHDIFKKRYDSGSGHAFAVYFRLAMINSPKAYLEYFKLLRTHEKAFMGITSLRTGSSDNHYVLWIWGILPLRCASTKKCFI